MKQKLYLCSIIKDQKFPGFEDGSTKTGKDIDKDQAQKFQNLLPYNISASKRLERLVRYIWRFCYNVSQNGCGNTCSQTKRLLGTSQHAFRWQRKWLRDSHNFYLPTIHYCQPSGFKSDRKPSILEAVGGRSNKIRRYGWVETRKRVHPHPHRVGEPC